MARSGNLLIIGLAGLSLAACTGEDFRNLGPGLSRPAPVQVESRPRPKPDSRGVISYPSYQVVVARKGDTVADVAARIGLEAAELARFNGLYPDSPLNEGEILALPRRVASSGGVDIASIASSAIDRADAQESRTQGTTAAPDEEGIEPIRHKVRRGETAYSIARLYGVSVRALAQWNGLGPDLAVREGQYLLIPLPRDGSAPQAVDTTPPGTGSPAPPPPSSTQPLPREQTVAVAPPPPPDLGAPAGDSGTMLQPVEGRIVSKFTGQGRQTGIDIETAPGATVLAALDGTVALVREPRPGRWIILIRHEGELFTAYADVTGVRVKKGDLVQRGQPIARVAPGNPPTMRFEVRQGTVAVDPAKYLK